MTAFPDNAMMTTLRKLITHEKSARSIGSIEEAESFAAKIQELMFKHKLAMTDVEYSEQENIEPVLSEFVREGELTGCARSGRRAESWVWILMGAVSRANFCRACGMSGGGHSFFVFGRASDRAATKAMFRYLYEACLEAAPVHTERYQPTDLEKMWATNAALKRRFSQGFKLGFASGVAIRLRSQVVALRAGAGERGLMRIDRLAREVDAKAENFGPLHSRRVTAIRGGSGYETGKAYGGAIGINSTRRLGS